LVIKNDLQELTGYNLNEAYNTIQPAYSFDETCQGSVPQALIAFFESTDFESAIRLAVSLGGDADSQACIVGGIAEAYYKEIPQRFIDKCLAKLTPEMKKLLNRLYKAYNLNKSTLADRMQSEGFGNIS